MGETISEEMPPEEIINQKKQLFTINPPASLHLKCYGEHKKILGKKMRLFLFLFYKKKTVSYEMKLLIFWERHNKIALQKS